jgi:hypothetical protein
LLNSPWRQEITNAGIVHAIHADRTVAVVVSASASTSAYVFLLWDVALHLVGKMALATAFARRKMVFCAPLKPPSL